MNLSMDRANEGLGSEWGLQSDFDYIDLIVFLLGLIYMGLWEVLVALKGVVLGFLGLRSYYTFRWGFSIWGYGSCGVEVTLFKAHL